MDNSALLTLLSVVISAIITSTGTVIAAYISKDKGKKANPPIETILRLPGHDSSSLKLETKKFCRDCESLGLIGFCLELRTQAHRRWKGSRRA